MAEPADAERTTGYVLAGISLLGQRKALPTVVDDSALAFPTVLVSAGRRGCRWSCPGRPVRLTRARTRIHRSPTQNGATSTRTASAWSPSSNGSSRWLPGGRLMRVTPLGVVTSRAPSAEVVGPAGCMGLEPVPAAQAAEVVAVGRSALGVRDDVVEVRPAGPVAAAGLAAAVVAGGPTASERRWANSCRSEAVAARPGTGPVGMSQAAAAHRLFEFPAGEGGEQAASCTEQIQVERATGGRLQAAGADRVERSEQGPQMRRGDGPPSTSPTPCGRPPDPGRPGRAAGSSTARARGAPR